MSKTLVIVESPGKIKKLGAILGSSYIVKASVGHIRDLPENDLGFSTTTFETTYVPTERGRGVIADLKKAAADADDVILATDLDREGEAIAWHIAQALRLKSPKRITFGEITPAAVKAAIAAPRAINLDLVRAQEGRRVLDRLVGYTVSPELSDRHHLRLSAGRVQSPTVRLVVDRERAIRGFTSTKHFGVELAFTGEWTAVWDTKPHLPKGERFLIDADLAQRAAAIRAVQVLRFEDSETTEAPPAPFTTSTMQQAGEALKWKPKKIMDVAQRLFEQGVISYHRTDSPNLSDEAFAAVRSLPGLGAAVVESKRTWKAKASAQEAHEAIRPAHFEDRDAGENADERALYRLIWSRAVASQLVDARYAVRTATLESVPAPKSSGMTNETPPPVFRFTARGRTLTSSGWRALYADPRVDDDAGEDEDDGTPTNNPVPVLRVGDAVAAESGRVLAKATKPPPRFKQVTLVKELEARGIGRPSTYAAILENVTKRTYIVEDAKGFLTPGVAGELIVDSLVGTCAFADYDYTKKLEDALDDIAEGKGEYRALLAGAQTQLAGELTRLAADRVVFACPSCAKPLRRRSSKTGAFWGCSGYPECNLTLPDVAGKPGARVERPAPAVNLPSCPECGKALRRNTRAKADDPKRKGWDFFGCLGYPACRATFNVDANGMPIFTPRSAAAGGA